ncbi:MAG TPA: TlpA disulfide reductase family protein [Gaiellaceae bacterium]|nr:TlpA disulfide reductase family protein [Gaiellaceae bacterium]
MPRPLKLSAQALTLAVVAGLLALLIWRVTHQAKSTRVGKAVPGFRAERLDGRGELSLASFRGKPVVLNFWASWCNPCKTEAPALERTWRAYRSRGLVVLGVDYTDASSDARRFVTKRGLTFPIVRDPSGKIGNSYRLTGVPETFVIDRKGRLVEHLLAPVDSGRNRSAFAQAIRDALVS